MTEVDIDNTVHPGAAARQEIADKFEWGNGFHAPLPILEFNFT
jgi:hypothetical protein